jgi:ferredoxin
MNDVSPSYAVDARACIRCAACSSVAPANFTVGAGPATLVRPPANEEERFACNTAARLCPTQAIRYAHPPSFDRDVAREESSTDLYPALAEVSEGARWKIADLPWSSFDASKVSPQLRDLVRIAAFSEQTTFSATQKFMQHFADDGDFTQWVSIWFYEETRHPMALMRWLSLSGESFDAEFVSKGRVSAPFMKSLVGTLVINIVSEIVAANAYRSMWRTSPEPLLSAIGRRIAGDESRHAAGFFRFAQRRIARSDDLDRDRLDALKVLHFWLNDSENVSHPVNQAMAIVRSLSPEAVVNPNERICQVIGQLIGLPIQTPAAVHGLFTELALRVHAVA